MGCNFMTEYSSGKITLRPFADTDMALMERWLYASHVQAWYEHPEEWLMELRERDGEFSFITHIIAEINGRPIGFCQYYDCWHSKEYEDWGIDIPSEGRIFSIDYLVGEPECLRRGFGKAMIALMLERLRGIGADRVLVLPDAKNTASNRALEANGFSWDGERYILQLDQA
jgi:RimJ/RimL family protein N-acetyltransferase